MIAQQSSGDRTMEIGKPVREFEVIPIPIPVELPEEAPEKEPVEPEQVE